MLFLKIHRETQKFGLKIKVLLKQFERQTFNHLFIKAVKNFEINLNLLIWQKKLIVDRIIAMTSRKIQMIERKCDELAASFRIMQQTMIAMLIVKLMQGVMKSHHFVAKIPLSTEPCVDIGKRPSILDKI